MRSADAVIEPSGNASAAATPRRKGVSELTAARGGITTVQHINLPKKFIQMVSYRRHRLRRRPRHLGD